MLQKAAVEVNPRPALICPLFLNVVQQAHERLTVFPVLTRPMQFSSRIPDRHADSYLESRYSAAQWLAYETLLAYRAPGKCVGHETAKALQRRPATSGIFLSPLTKSIDS
ncbi:uncharacterized protein SCHCODRAFT_02613532 [Schizophyllum commune H4-8]|uniref:uncharacterized protein n=1 Tax=Schizophyllum commune (strain H4-8 / FGSC 9210) TaxID=578458 RepID=UPI0021609F73|nr:uncharacterized protein SCHCODRAFT_02613532 [Schizophyllum commune H4-8]KAI5898914.1 hypothetical protein SCHCODRAFT_02613532 [Schizophyllum commune H4-8]